MARTSSPNHLLSSVAPLWLPILPKGPCPRLCTWKCLTLAVFPSALLFPMVRGVCRTMEACLSCPPHYSYTRPQKSLPTDLLPRSLLPRVDCILGGYSLGPRDSCLEGGRWSFDRIGPAGPHAYMWSPWCYRSELEVRREKEDMQRPPLVLLSQAPKTLGTGQIIALLFFIVQC